MHIILLKLSKHTGDNVRGFTILMNRREFAWVAGLIQDRERPVGQACLSVAFSNLVGQTKKNCLVVEKENTNNIQ